MQMVQGVGIPATPYAKMLAKQNGIDLTTIVPSGAHGEIKAKDILENALAVPRATRLARRIAKKNNIDLRSVIGTGTADRITKKDVLEIMAKAPSQEVVEESALGDEIIKMTPMRRAISKNMTKSAQEIPTVTNFIKVDVTTLLEIRAGLNKGKEKEDKVSLNDFFIIAVAKALAKNERFRMEYCEDHFLLHNYINVGMAVGMADGLVVPVLRDVDKMNIFEVAKTSKELAKKARDGKLAPDDMSGGVITISNLGMFGTLAFTPIINQPQASIVGVCDVNDELEIINGQIQQRKKTILCTTYDHRIVNGTEAAAFMNDVRDLLENPGNILV